MSLLPIIYTSLIIFSSVLFVVLVISYLSYRYKQSSSVALVGINNAPTSYKAGHHRNSNPASFSNTQQKLNQTDNALNRLNDQIKHYPKTKSNYYKDQRHIGDRRIDVIYREKVVANVLPPSQIRRMSVVEDISKNSRPENNYTEQREYRPLEISNNTGKNILRYYDDF